MNQSSNVQETLARLLSVSWEPDYARSESHLYLVLEHFRRMALWAKALDCTDKWPYFDVAAVINPEIRADENAVGSLTLHLKNQGFVNRDLLGDPCIWSLHWAALIDNGIDVLAFDLPDPYEPMLIVYERGGLIEREHGHMILTTGMGFMKKGWRDHYKFEAITELDEETLDKLDEGWREERKK